MDTIAASKQKPSYSEEEMERAAQLGEAIYEERLQALLEPDYDGQVAAIHPESGDYEVAETCARAWSKLHARRPEGPYFLRDIGVFPATLCPEAGSGSERPGQRIHD